MNLQRLSAALTVALLASVGVAADVKGFLAARKKAKITQISSMDDLGSLKGTQYVEIRGATKGSMAVDGITKLLLEASPTTLCVELPDDEQWLATPNSQARLIMKLYREHEFAGWTAEIVEAVPENAIADWEEKNAPKPAVKSSVRSSSPGVRPSSAPGASRGSSGRLIAMPRNSNDPRAQASTQSPSPTSGRTTYLQTSLSQWGIAEHSTVPTYANFILQHSKKITAEEARVAAAAIVAFSMEYGIDPRFIVALVICESDFDPGCTSYAGAMGLGQIMPFTRDEMKVSSAYDIISNIYCTVRHFRKYYDRYAKNDSYSAEQKLTLAIAAYNAGPGNVQKFGGVPPFPKTQAYIQKMLAWYRKLSGQG